MTESVYKSKSWYCMPVPEVNSTLSDALVCPNKCVLLKLSL